MADSIDKLERKLRRKARRATQIAEFPSVGGSVATIVLYAPEPGD